VLNSRRFTASVTQNTRERLDLVLDNSRPMTRRETSRGAVVAVQSALADLNQGYLVQAEVDGYFGTRTAEAVEMFQRDYGLAADGIVGRQTLTQLDQLFTSDSYRNPQGMSIHVGVNTVDPAHYGAGVVPLAACVNDASAFRDVSVSLGYDDVILTNENATTANFTAAMRQAATNLFAGDYLFVTFSGHGSQITNNSSDEEADLMDETLCFYDRMLIDDELHALLSELRAGVHVTLIYDSCHSGTVTRMLVQDNTQEEEALVRLRATISRGMTRSMETFIHEMPRDIPADQGNPAVAEAPPEDENRFIPYDRTKLDKVLDGDRVDQPAPRGISDADLARVVSLIVDTRADAEKGARKAFDYRDTVPSEQRQSNFGLYSTVKNIVGSHENRQLECTVVALSACEDSQETLDGAVNGMFTGNILSIWDNGGFTGSYRQLHARLLTLAQSKPNITPVINTYGGRRAEARLFERPLSF